MGRIVEDAASLYAFANSYEECMNSIEAISGRIKDELTLAEIYLRDDPSKRNIAEIREKIEDIRVISTAGQSLVEATRTRARLIEDFLQQNS